MHVLTILNAIAYIYAAGHSRGVYGLETSASIVFPEVEAFINYHDLNGDNIRLYIYIYMSVYNL